MVSDEELLRRRRRSLSPSYRLFYERPVHLVRGEGAWLFDAEGRRYLDCYNNVASVGHCHPHVVEALCRQAATLNTHTRYLHETVVRYAERLTGTLPDGLEVCMFVCTGTEANDLAVRIARAATGNSGIIVTQNAYHGNSATVFGMSTEECPEGERPDCVETVEAPCTYRGSFADDDNAAMQRFAGQVDDAIAALARRGHRPAMFICDSIFSSDGVLTPRPEYLQQVYRRIRAAGGLAVADEVQSGLCRLGDHFWGFQDSAVVPDIVTLGKPLGDGHPLAAVVTTPDIAERFAARFDYFNTFGGNPVSAAVGLAVLDVIQQQEIQRNVLETGAYLRAGLLGLAERHQLIGDVRGKGLFHGLELVRDRGTREPADSEAGRIRELLRENGVLLGTTGPFDNVIKIRPPLVFTRDQAQLLLDHLERVLSTF
jgi:4-aminobutyrate aminotransferase-like enzyme